MIGKAERASHGGCTRKRERETFCETGKEIPNESRGSKEGRSDLAASGSSDNDEDGGGESRESVEEI